ncbi:DUF2182 domain-containing protein [Streptomyces sp. S.PNR 29]|uniref:DUF2182 domain-containing protein n=1 Tax=Streptomyces sp. S.PNR 29 TaxID=2973805 RepID=UPI0025AF33C3|nr:DUF2182 domain-containing protein [Streptomyces sp. S.PNR 29]MDN0198339.1 DUF2182 domain-containing protein [Streptomyces sp. S.PNR 29]
MPHLRLAPPASTRPAFLLPARDLALGWILLTLIAALAWLLTVDQSRDMGTEPGTMGLALPLFLLLWVVMMVAMMLPSLAPVALTWGQAVRRSAPGSLRSLRTAEFVCGYLLAWAAFGLPAYGALAATGRLVDSHPDAGRWIGAAAFLLAGLQQFGPLKRVCLRHCRDPMSQLLRYARLRHRAKDLRVGAHHGLSCVGCCWGLMIVLVPLGLMNVAATAMLAVVIFLEKLWRGGPRLSQVVGVAFLVLAVLAVLAPFQEWLLPGLEMPGPSMDRMARVEGLPPRAYGGT